MLKYLVLVVLCFFVSLQPVDSRAEEPTDDLHGIFLYYTLAANATEAGNLKGARQCILDGLEVIPSSPHLRLSLARTSLALGDTAACLEAIRSMAVLGTSFDLKAYPPLAEIAGLPQFKDAVARLLPVPPPAAKVTTVLNDPDLWTEGIAWDSATGDLYAGSVKLCKFVRIRGQEQSDLGTSASDSLLEIIGLDIDPQRRLLWAASGRDRAQSEAAHDFGEAPRDNAIVAYDLDTGRQVANHFRSADADDVIHMWNDVSVALDGTVYFTDMATSSLWHIPPVANRNCCVTLKR